MPTPPPPPASAVVAPEPLPQQLRRLTEGLLFISESEALVQVVELPSTNDDLPAALRLDAQVPATTPLREQPLEDILAERAAPPEGAGQTDRRQAPAYAALLTLLRTQLRAARAVRVGEGAPQTLYLIGRTPDGRCSAVSTEPKANTTPVNVLVMNLICATSSATRLNNRQFFKGASRPHLVGFPTFPWHFQFSVPSFVFSVARQQAAHAGGGSRFPHPAAR